MNFYRFSISWSRILPRGDASEINSAGLQYYSNLIDELLANGIEPMITIYHFDLPQPLQEIGGLTNPAIVDYFVEYARVLFTAYGARVRTWITMNEPWVQCIAGYSDNLFAPGVYAPGVGNYLCSHHMMLAHGRIYELYHKTPAFRRSDGRIGMSVVCEGMFPRDPQNATHVAAAERAMQFVVSDGRGGEMVLYTHRFRPPPHTKLVRHVFAADFWQRRRLSGDRCRHDRTAQSC